MLQDIAGGVLGGSGCYKILQVFFRGAVGATRYCRGFLGGQWVLQDIAKFLRWVLQDVAGHLLGGRWGHLPPPPPPLKKQ